MSCASCEGFLGTFDYGLAGLDALMSDDSDLNMLSDGADVSDGLSSIDAAFQTVASPMRLGGNAARVVVQASLQPVGSRASIAVAKSLLAKSVVLGRMAHDRAQVAYRARDERDNLTKAVDRLQKPIEALATNNTETGRVRLDTLRTRQYGFARRALQLHKVNVVATGMARNGAAQALLLQQMSATTALGQPAVTATLTAMYNKIGRGSEKFRELRKQQIIKSAEGDQQFAMRQLLDQKRKLLLARVDYLVVLSFPGVSAKARTQASLTALDKRIGEVDRQIMALFSRGNRGGSLGELEGWGVFGKIAKKIEKSAKGALKITIAPLKFTRSVFTKGPLAAIKSVPGALKHGFDIVKRTYADFTVGMACDVMRSGIGKMATSIAGTAVGTFYGGPVGGAVGAVAAGRVNDANARMCGALDKIGLTKGTFRTSKLGSALKDYAGGMAKDMTNKKKFLFNVMSVGKAYANSPEGSAALQKVGGEQISKLGIDENTIRQIPSALASKKGAQKFLQDQGARAAAQYGGQYAAQYGVNLTPQSIRQLTTRGGAQRFVQDQAAQQAARYGAQYGVNLTPQSIRQLTTRGGAQRLLQNQVRQQAVQYGSQYVSPVVPSQVRAGAEIYANVSSGSTSDFLKQLLGTG